MKQNLLSLSKHLPTAVYNSGCAIARGQFTPEWDHV